MRGSVLAVKRIQRVDAAAARAHVTLLEIETELDVKLEASGRTGAVVIGGTSGQAMRRRLTCSGLQIEMLGKLDAIQVAATGRWSFATAGVAVSEEIAGGRGDRRGRGEYARGGYGRRLCVGRCSCRAAGQ